MPNIVEIKYSQTGQSSKPNKFGMREMQERAFKEKESQYLLIKSPPASGKSRALMFIGLDKLVNQGVKKVIVAVPERSIAGSFAPAKLSDFGFFADWSPRDEYNLCTPGLDNATSKVQAFKNFMANDETIMICTHATLRFAYEELEDTAFNDCMLAIDEFHHVSADFASKLGELLKGIMRNSTAHVLAMTGSYFRGDGVPVLLPEDEEKFSKITYNYYDQLNGYNYLKSLGIGYHFYQGVYTSAILEILDTDKKTILHIPNVNSGESTKEKHNEVDTILDAIGDVISVDSETKVITLKRRNDGKLLKIADLVNDTPTDRDKIVAYLREIKAPEDMDLVIALGMAKEGFDWPYCEHALTVGYRGSLTEIIQIIGRCTRDSSNKTHSQFTNLIAQPDAADSQVKVSVNNMLKAITASLLMEQVLAPIFKFKAKLDDSDKAQPGEIKIKGYKTPSNEIVKNIIENDINDLKAAILQDDTMQKAMQGNIDPEVMNKTIIPKIIKIKYPNLNDEDVEEVRQFVVVDSVVKSGEIKEENGQRFIKMASQFINIDDLHIDLIDRINPFQRAFEILSKNVNASVLKLIQEAIEGTRIQMTAEEAIILWPKIKAFVQQFNRQPGIQSLDPLERRMAEAIIYLKEQKRKEQNGR